MEDDSGRPTKRDQLIDFLDELKKLSEKYGFIITQDLDEISIINSVNNNDIIATNFQFINDHAYIVDKSDHECYDYWIKNSMYQCIMT